MFKEMKKYKDRYLRKISNSIRVAYLFIAILWGIATFSFQNEREELDEDFIEGEISKKEYLQECMKFSEDEENLFKTLFTYLGVVAVSDVVFSLLTKDKEF